MDIEDYVKAHAACAGEDTELFFNHETREQAKTICRRCDVIDECLDLVIHDTTPGIWGGTDSEQRMKLRRALRRKGAL